MHEELKELYYREVDSARLDFDRDPEYQEYFTRSKALWKGKDMPEALFGLLEAGNFLSFAHGLRLGMRLSWWGQGDAAPGMSGLRRG